MTKVWWKTIGWTAVIAGPCSLFAVLLLVALARPWLVGVNVWLVWGLLAVLWLSVGWVTFERQRTMWAIQRQVDALGLSAHHLALLGGFPVGTFWLRPNGRVGGLRLSREEASSLLASVTAYAVQQQSDQPEQADQGADLGARVVARKEI